MKRRKKQPGLSMTVCKACMNAAVPYETWDGFTWQEMLWDEDNDYLFIEKHKTSCPHEPDNPWVDISTDRVPKWCKMKHEQMILSQDLKD